MPSCISWTEHFKPHLVISKIHAIGHKGDGWIVRQTELAQQKSILWLVKLKKGHGSLVDTGNQQT